MLRKKQVSCWLPIGQTWIHMYACTHMPNKAWVQAHTWIYTHIRCMWMGGGSFFYMHQNFLPQFLLFILQWLFCLFILFYFFLQCKSNIEDDRVEFQIIGEDGKSSQSTGIFSISYDQNTMYLNVDGQLDYETVSSYTVRLRCLVRVLLFVIFFKLFFFHWPLIYNGMVKQAVTQCTIYVNWDYNRRETGKRTRLTSGFPPSKTRLRHYEM